MGQHRRQFIPAGHHANQSQMQSEVAPRQREGIDRPIPPEKDFPGKALVEFGREFATRPGRLQQRLPDRLDVFAQNGVVNVVGIPVELPHDTLTEPALGAGSHLAAVAHGRKLCLGPPCRRDQERYQNNCNQ